jgi:hypothetical protein
MLTPGWNSRLKSCWLGRSTWLLKISHPTLNCRSPDFCRPLAASPSWMRIPPMDGNSCLSSCYRKRSQSHSLLWNWVVCVSWILRHFDHLGQSRSFFFVWNPLVTFLSFFGYSYIEARMIFFKDHFTVVRRRAILSACETYLLWDNIV